MAGKLAFWGIFTAILAANSPHSAYKAGYGHFWGEGWQEVERIRGEGQVQCARGCVDRRERQRRALLRYFPSRSGLGKTGAVMNVVSRRPTHTRAH